MLPSTHSPTTINATNTMPTQRPFFANFLAAFRAHSAIQQQSKGPSPSTAQPSHVAATQASTSSTQHPSNPRSIATKTPGATTSALNQLHSPRATSTSPLSRSPGQAPTGYMQRADRETRRRGSDSSSEGFRDVLSPGAEKWYIGGRTAAGEERFFKLGVVRRERSLDRLSLDRLSL